MIREKKHYQEQSDKARMTMDETEEFRVKTVDKSFSQQLVRYRMDRKWKRQDLARFLCMKENEIAALETGKEIHNGQLIHKIKQKLKL
jgi:ribosome-binding protein aMBF1 (putative translation factor)